jgi:regulator of replication initiation timing
MNRQPTPETLTSLQQALERIEALQSQRDELQSQREMLQTQRDALAGENRTLRVERDLLKERWPRSFEQQNPIYKWSLQTLRMVNRMSPRSACYAALATGGS